MEVVEQNIADTVAAEETYARLDALLRTAVDAIITISDRGIIETVNLAAERMFDRPATDLTGQNISILMPKRFAMHHDRWVSGETLSVEKVLGRTREISGLRSDGSEFPIELALSSADIQGRRIFTGIIRDVSQRRAAEKELKRHHDLLEQRVAERTAELEAANRDLEFARDQLQRTNEKLEQLVRVDELTGIANRRALRERLRSEWDRMQREQRPLCVMICDVDYFKKYNDTYGHPAGDVCLCRVSEAMQHCFQRATEFVARHGGEEFAVVMSGADLDEGRQRAETLLQEIRSLQIDNAGAGKMLTISVGVASVVPDRSKSLGKLVAAADAALYRAKEAGRDRVETAAYRAD
ncbi:MAG: diguanylate cyclase [Gammaproteobacteria bacterium]|nr:diguanylate cyclase [Gammaproteobacteria bacterium]